MTKKKRMIIYRNMFFETRKDGIFSGLFLCNLKDTLLNSEDFLCINLMERATKKRAYAYNTEAQFKLFFYDKHLILHNHS